MTVVYNRLPGLVDWTGGLTFFKTKTPGKMGGFQQRFVQFTNKVLYSSETKFRKANFSIYPMCAKVNGMQSTLNPTLNPEIPPCLHMYKVPLVTSILVR